MFNRNIYSKEAIKDKLEFYKQLLNFFDEEIFLTTTEWDGDDILTHIKQTFDKVENYLKSKKIDKEQSKWNHDIDYTIEYYSYFPQVVELALSGKRSLAYEKFAKHIMTKNSMAFMTFNQLTNHYTGKSDADYVYRIRVDEKTYNSNFTAEDLFHIPYEKRFLIGNNRFSLSGFPCLYFGNNVYCCWEELNKPRIENCFISKFDLTGHHFIDISRSPAEINYSLENFYNSLQKTDDSAHEHFVLNFEYLLDDYLKIWPLIFCCSIRTYYNDSVFKPEYIFPQLLLEWIVTDKWAHFDGIIYNSTKKPSLLEKFTSKIDKKMKLKNYVIPARVLKAKGFCEESKNKLKLTDPLNIDLENLTDPNSFNSSSDLTDQPYANSIFGRIENKLENFELKKL